MNKKTIVYTKNQCGGCVLTKQLLDGMGIAYETVNISEKPERVEDILDMGFQSLPVVVVEGEEPFAGYNPARIADIFE